MVEKVIVLMAVKSSSLEKWISEKILTRWLLAVINMDNRTGHYPELILVDHIYRTRKNREFCKSKGIRMFCSKLRWPGKEKQAKIEKKEKYLANTDRIEVEREFSVEKQVMD